MLELIIVIGGPGVVLLVLEWILIHVTRQGLRPLRFVPLLTLLIPFTLAVQEWQTRRWFWQLGVALYLIMAAWMFLCWCFAWIGSVGARKSTNPNTGDEDA